jgi:hypothetical protein
VLRPGRYEFARVYFDTSHNVNELAWQPGWVANAIAAQAVNSVTGQVGAPPAAPGSDITCFGVNGTDSRVYYLAIDNNNNYSVIELSWQNGGWVYTLVSSQAGAPPAAPDSALACFGVGGTNSHGYYFDTSHNVNELAWQPGWVANAIAAQAVNSVTGQVGAPPAASDSDITCFGVDGTDSRVYYLDETSKINELAWMGSNFIVTPL